MKRILSSLVIIGLVAAAPVVSVADVFFSDDFSTSTVNQPPVAPTATSTSYEVTSGKSWNPTPTISNGALTFGIGATSAGIIDVQALFATNPVTLVLPGDYIEMTVTFTNTAGLLTGAGFLGFGLYNSGQVFPVSGGLNGTASTSASDYATGGAQNWQGYVGYVGFTGSDSRIMNRDAQTGTANNNQELVTRGSSSQSYRNPAAANVGPISTSAVLTLVAGQTYTENLRIIFVGENTLAITNRIYSGADTNGTLLCEFGGETSASTFLTAGFDALAIGWYARNSTPTTMDISSIQVAGQATPISGPPEIVSQPSPVSVPVGAAGAFFVGASGYSMTYQWHRYGTNLVDGGNISGAKSSVLVISPASADDVASGANGYYVTVSGAGGYSTNSITNSLSLRTAANLTWSGSGNVWDLNTTANWLSGASPAVFNFGDNVTFNDTGTANLTVNLEGEFLSASSVTVNSSAMVDYVFSGTGKFAGPGRLNYIGSGFLTLNNANSYSGGTLISNASAYVVLNNYDGLGTGPVTLGKAGGNMEIVNAGNANLGIKGDIIVADDFNITYDATSAYGAVFLGKLSGSVGKTLTLTLNPSATGVSRVRVYGADTVCDANLNLVDSRTVFAAYQGTQTYNGVISGGGAFMQKGTTTYLNGANTYSGGTFPATGTIGLGRNSVGVPVTSGPIGTGPLLLAPDSTTTTVGSGTVLAWGGARSIANPIQYPSATNNQTLIIGGTNALTLSGPITLNGDDGATPVYSNRIFQADNTALTTFSGVISDGGYGFGLTKTGNGTLALNNTETYTGPTVVSNGTLQVNGQLAAASAVTVATNAVLAGTGTIGGSVTVNAGGAVAPGTSIGTLNIGGNLSLAGNLNIEVNRASLASDRISVTGTLANTGTGTVTVTNTGAALQAGDTFTLFSGNKALSNGAALTVTGGGAIWNNKLGIDGTIEVQSVVATTPTNISYSLSGTSLTLSWPPNYLTWILQSNSVGIASSASWFAVPGSENSTQFIVTLDPAKPNVFYRLLRP